MGLWLTREFKWRSVRGIVREQTVGDEMRNARILALLPPAQDQNERDSQIAFTRIVTQTIEVTGLDVVFPDEGAGPGQWLLFYEVFWKRMANGLAGVWLEAISDVDQPEGSREYWPTHFLTDEEKKILLQSGLLTNGKSTNTSEPLMTIPAS